MRCVRTTALALAALVGGCAAPVVAYRQLPLETITAPAPEAHWENPWLDAVRHDLPPAPPVAEDEDGDGGCGQY